MIDKLAIAVISPLGTSLFLGLAGFLLWFFHARRLAFTAVTLAFLWLFFWSLPVVSTQLLRHLENQHPPQAMAEIPRAEAIVVLGGGLWWTEIPHQPVNMGSAADRAWYGAQLYHRDKAPVVIASGGAWSGGRSEAEAITVLLKDLGVLAGDILQESGSRNTRENARNTASLMAATGMERIILVTSAYHMKRAVRHFEAEGVSVIPAATDYESDQSRFSYPWLPDAAALDMSGRALKEVVGQLVWRGG